eukprot:COSAG01_NODE_31747_length_592_cov_0.720081_1_plen_157_part_01
MEPSDSQDRVCSSSTTLIVLLVLIGVCAAITSILMFWCWVARRKLRHLSAAHSDNNDGGFSDLSLHSDDVSIAVPRTAYGVTGASDVGSPSLNGQVGQLGEPPCLPTTLDTSATPQSTTASSSPKNAKPLATTDGTDTLPHPERQVGQLGEPLCLPI